MPSHSRRLSRRPLIASLLALGASAALAQPLPTATPESVGMSTERLNRITTTLQNEVREKRLPGAVVMVARKGKLVYSQAVGELNSAAGGAMKTDSIFRIYSMTKPLASTAVMILVEEGKIQLTDPVSKYLPSFKSPMVSVPTLDPVFHGVSFRLVAANREPTIQELLRHTSGIAYGELTRTALVREAYVKAGVYKPTLDFDARELAGAQMADQLGKAPLTQQPGTTWEYSLSVDVQGRVVEAVTASAWASSCRNACSAL